MESAPSHYVDWESGRKRRKKKQQIKGTDQPGGGDWGAKEENIN
jgi:uncharacterized protein HemY